MPRPPDDWTDRLADALRELGAAEADSARDLAARVRALVDDEDADPDADEEAPARPTLHVLRGHAPPPPEDDDDDPPWTVRVARFAELQRGLEVGQLRLAASPDVLQTVFQGRRPAAYRVHCDDGEVLVVVDGEPALRLEPGQSADVEGSVIRARSGGGAGSSGRFIRLPS